MSREEFSTPVENNSSSNLSVDGSVDVTSDSTRDLGAVDIANQPLGVDDSTPIAVEDQSAGGGKVDVVQMTVVQEQTLSAGGSASATISPPSGEVWEVIGVFYHGDITSATSGDLRLQTIYQDGGDYTPHNYLSRRHVSNGYKAWTSVGFNSAYQDSSGNWVDQATATNHVNEANATAPYWLPNSMRIRCNIENTSDASAYKARATALVRKYQVA